MNRLAAGLVCLLALTGCATPRYVGHLSCPPRVVARYWTMDQPELVSPEARFATYVEQSTGSDALVTEFAGLKARTADFGVCFSGGGTRSASATVGQLRGLREIGLLDRVRYVSAVSGGSWAATPFVYLPAGLDEQDFLGRYREPKDLDLGSFTHATAGSFVETVTRAWITQRFMDRFFFCGAGDESYSQAIGDIFLKPFGLDEQRFFTWSGASRDRIVRQNSASNGARPGLTADDFYVVERTNRPYLVINGAISRKADHDGRSPYRTIPVEFTPLYAGTRACFLYAGPKERPIGGGFVEPLGYDGAIESLAHEPYPSATVTLGRNWMPGVGERFTLADAIGCSGAAPSSVNILADWFGFPEFRVWSPQYAGDFEAQEVWHGDGGLVDNSGVMALLARRVKNIVVFCNAVRPFLPESPNPEDVVDPYVSSLFGVHPTDDEGAYLLRVFPKEEFDKMIASFREQASKGMPLVYGRRDMPVSENLQFGIPEQKVNVVFYYLGPLRERLGDPNAWFSAIRPEVMREVDKARELKNFPHLQTFLENKGTFLDGGVIRLTPIQANAMAHMTSWQVVQMRRLLEYTLDVERAP